MEKLHGKKKSEQYIYLNLDPQTANPGVIELFWNPGDYEYRIECEG